MRLNKSTAFIIGLIAPMTIFVMMYISHEPTQYGTIITGIVSLTTLFMGANVTDHVAKGKYYRAELDTNKK